MASDDVYGRVTAKYYDGAYAELRDSSGDSEWYRRLARDAQGPVLELGCGTGRVLLPIARQGIECVGLDASPAMLDVLRGQGPPPNLRLVEGRLQDFDLGGEKFGLIFSAFRVFQHLYTVDDQLACLERVRAHLAPGGALAFDAFVPRLSRMAVVEEEEQEDVRFRRGDDEIVRYASARRDPLEQMTEVRMRYERVRDGAVVDEDVVTFSMRHFYRFELEHLLARSGFANFDLYGDFDGRPFASDATSFVVVARAG